MIEGATHFHYLGLARHERGVMMVFQEGVLILDLGYPGWGIMPPSDRRKLMPHPSDSPSSSGYSSGDNSDSTGDVVIDSASSELFDTSTSHSSDSEPSSASASPRGSRSASPSPSGHEDPAPRAWSPSPAALGWHPAEEMVWVGAVSRKAVDAFKSLVTTHDLQGFVAQLKLKNCPWAPLPAGHPGDATVVAMVVFGELVVLNWLGIWHGSQPQNGMSAALACQIAERSITAHVCSLAEVPKAELSEYHGHIVSGQASILAFDRGLLVEQHSDPELVGWHPLGEHGHWGIVTPDDARIVQQIYALKTPSEHGLHQFFLNGSMDAAFGVGPFAAAIHSSRGSWVHMQLDQPHFQRPQDPQGPNPAAVQHALYQARWAPIQDPQSTAGLQFLASGEWQVPLFLAVIRCISTTVDVPGLIGTTWHTTLQPAIERCLLAYRAHESAWLASGAIAQPVDHLIDLMRRDVALRRPQVRVMWPVELLADLFKTLAPHERFVVIPSPKAADFATALQQRACTLLVFQTPGVVELSIVLAQGPKCWDGQTWIRAEALKERVATALGGVAGERLMALAFVV